jgi:hypothetical protein
MLRNRLNSEACALAQPPTLNHLKFNEDEMRQVTRKSSQTRSSVNPTKARKTTSSRTLALKITPEKSIKQPIKPHNTHQSASAALKRTAGRKPKHNSNDAPDRSATSSSEPTTLVAIATATPSEIDAARSSTAAPMHLMAFWLPTTMLAQQQTLMTSLMLNVMQAQQYWVRGFNRVSGPIV